MSGGTGEKLQRCELSTGSYKMRWRKRRNTIPSRGEESIQEHSGVRKAQDSTAPAESLLCLSVQASTGEAGKDEATSLTVDASLRQFGLLHEQCGGIGVVKPVNNVSFRKLTLMAVRGINSREEREKLRRE